MSVLRIEVIADCSPSLFQKDVNSFFEYNEDMVDHTKTVYSITQEKYPDDDFGPNCMRSHTIYSAIFQMEGDRRYES